MIWLILEKYFLITSERKKGIKNISATGRRTSIEEIDEALFNMTGIAKGRRNATAKLVTRIEITVNSILPFNKLTITGDAIAVGAIAVIKAI